MNRFVRLPLVAVLILGGLFRPALHVTRAQDVAATATPANAAAAPQPQLTALQALAMVNQYRPLDAKIGAAGIFTAP